MNRLSISHQAVRESFSIAWRNKKLWWYAFFLILAASSFSFMALYILKRFGIQLSLAKIPDWNLVSFVWQVIIVFVEYLIVMLIGAALLNNLYALLSNKKMSFSSSFSFARGLFSKIFVWGMVITVFILFRHYWIIKKGFNITCDFTKGWSCQAISLKIEYSTFFIWLLSCTVFLALGLAAYYVLPILVKYNKSVWQAIKESITLIWKRLLITILSYLSALIYSVFLFLLLFIPIFVIIWLICSVFAIIPFGLWLLPFGIVTLIPGTFLLLYLVVVNLILPGVLYMKLRKLR